MDRFETVEIPVRRLDDGREFIALIDIVRLGAEDFIQKFSNYWTRDYYRCGFISPRKEP